MIASRWAAADYRYGLMGWRSTPAAATAAGDLPRTTATGSCVGGLKVKVEIPSAGGIFKVSPVWRQRSKKPLPPQIQFSRNKTDLRFLRVLVLFVANLPWRIPRAATQTRNHIKPRAGSPATEATEQASVFGEVISVSALCALWKKAFAESVKYLRSHPQRIARLSLPSLAPPANPAPHDHRLRS